MALLLVILSEGCSNALQIELNCMLKQKRSQHLICEPVQSNLRTSTEEFVLFIGHIIHGPVYIQRNQYWRWHIVWQISSTRKDECCWWSIKQTANKPLTSLQIYHSSSWHGLVSPSLCYTHPFLPAPSHEMPLLLYKQKHRYSSLITLFVISKHPKLLSQS